MDYPNPQEYYTKAEVDIMIAAAVAEAHEADRISMANKKMERLSTRSLVFFWVRIVVYREVYHLPLFL